jgi:signal transduction histidine kinase
MNRGVLLQVFDNLIANSLYWLRADGVKNGAILAIVDATRRTVTLEDSGPGVAPAFADLIFRPFVSTKPNGRGLGLFIARELLELEGGTITLRDDVNQRGRRYVFEIGLPRRAKRS